MAAPPTLGIEEEFFVIDPVSRFVVPNGRPVLDRLDKQGLVGGSASYGHELLLSTIEARSRVCSGLAELRANLEDLRRRLVRAAADEGRTIVAAGTPPLADWSDQRVTPSQRYQQLAERQQQLARDLLLCGCHVHVGIGSQETCVEVVNRARPWLPCLLALSSSSPFWMGAATGYASYRSIAYSRWATVGIPEVHRSVAEYQAVVRTLIDTGVILDAAQIYWDVRLNETHGTVEFRTADMGTTIDEAILQAGLCRALAQVCALDAASGRPLPSTRAELLRGARWRAARSGLAGMLVDVLAMEAVPAQVLLDRFLGYLRPVLEDTGDWDEVSALMRETVRRGTSSRRQMEAFTRSSRLEDVVDLLTRETVPGSPALP